MQMSLNETLSYIYLLKKRQQKHPNSNITINRWSGCLMSWDISYIPYEEYAWMWEIPDSRPQAWSQDTVPLRSYLDWSGICPCQGLCIWQRNGHKL